MSQPEMTDLQAKNTISQDVLFHKACRKSTVMLLGSEAELMWVWCCSALRDRKSITFYHFIILSVSMAMVDDIHQWAIM